jgi:hypothetical protein
MLHRDRRGIRSDLRAARIDAAGRFGRVLLLAAFQGEIRAMAAYNSFDLPRTPWRVSAGGRYMVVNHGIPSIQQDARPPERFVRFNSINLKLS